MNFNFSSTTRDPATVAAQRMALEMGSRLALLDRDAVCHFTTLLNTNEAQVHVGGYAFTNAPQQAVASIVDKCVADYAPFVPSRVSVDINHQQLLGIKPPHHQCVGYANRSTLRMLPLAYAVSRELHAGCTDLIGTNVYFGSKSNQAELQYIGLVSGVGSFGGKSGAMAVADTLRRNTTPFSISERCPQHLVLCAKNTVGASCASDSFLSLGGALPLPSNVIGGNPLNSGLVEILLCRQIAKCVVAKTGVEHCEAAIFEDRVGLTMSKDVALIAAAVGGCKALTVEKMRKTVEFYLEDIGGAFEDGWYADGWEWERVVNI